jgi:hypothetical protein
MQEMVDVLRTKHIGNCAWCRSSNSTGAVRAALCRENLDVLVGLADRLTGAVILLNVVILDGQVRVAAVDREELVCPPLGLACDLVARDGLAEHKTVIEFPELDRFEQGDGVRHVDGENPRPDLNISRTCGKVRRNVGIIKRHASRYHPQRVVSSLLRLTDMKTISAVMVMSLLTTAAGADKSGKSLHGRTTICKSANPLPAGFVAVNSLIDSSKCNGSTGMTNSNVWVIELYTDRKVNDTMDICDDYANPIPTGWSPINRFKSPNQCVPSSGFGAQGPVVQIRRFK